MATLRRQENLWPILWTGVVVFLVVIISLEHFFGQPGEGDIARAPAKVVEAKLLPDFSLPREVDSASDTAARPLFVPTRRPAPPVAVAAATEMKRGQFTLTGVTVTPDVSFVFLKEAGTGKTRSVKKGTEVNGMTLETVEPRRAVLKLGEETEILSLNVGVPPPVATPPVSTAGVNRTAAPPGTKGADAAVPGSAVLPGPLPSGLTIPGWPATPANGATNDAIRRQRTLRPTP